MIAMGSTAALKNLLVARGTGSDSRPNPATSPGLQVRRQRSLDRDFERHSDAGSEFASRQSFGGAAGQPVNGWVMSTSAGANLFPSTASGGVRRQQGMSRDKQLSLTLAPNMVLPASSEVPYDGPSAMADAVQDADWRRLMDQSGVKIPNSIAVSGSSSFTHGAEHSFQSVDNSPAIHRRVHGSGQLEYSLAVQNQVSTAYKLWSGSVAPTSNGHSDGGFDHFSRRMERVYYTNLPDCSQDEPINFSMKYKESAETSASQIVQRSSSSASVVESGNGLESVEKPVLNSPINRLQLSRQSLPNASSHRRDFVRSQPSKAAGYTKFAAIQFDVAGYGRSSMDMERPTNYSLQYAEHYEDDECTGGQFVDQPVDYSTRYMEPPAQTCRTSVFRDEHSSLYADTVKTFCTEGTPMNYQSTATSMTDLSIVRSNKNAHRRTHSSDDLDVDEVQDFSRKYSEPQVEDHSSAVRAFRWPQQQHVEGPAYSHGDSRPNEPGISSPGEKPRQYCTEGTPPEFSHSGSLNSLHSGSVTKSSNIQTTVASLAPSANKTSAAFNKPSETFPVTRIASSKAKGGVEETKDPAHGKTVTFDVDRTTQVEQTPLMFSRSSSLGSLSSFDIRSVHSSVVSEYSVRASQVVSPSELPDSPGNTMPPSPSAKPVMSFDIKANGDESVSSGPVADSNDVNVSSVQTETADTSALTVLPVTSAEQSFQPVNSASQSFQPVGNSEQFSQAAAICDQSLQPMIISDPSSPIHYCYEGSNMSPCTSLSALTCNGDDIHVSSYRGPRSLPLGEESAPDEPYAAAAEPRPTDSIDDDDDDDGISSPVTAEDEQRIAECIKLGMPPKRKKTSFTKMTRSSSDGERLWEQSDYASSLPSTSILNGARASITTSVSYNAMTAVVDQHALDAYEVDVPQQFATEDTPLNFSQSGSLSDLSSVKGGTDEPRDAAASVTVTKLTATACESDEIIGEKTMTGQNSCLWSHCCQCNRLHSNVCQHVCSVI